jgi:2'-5' RNA ligase
MCGRHCSSNSISQRCRQWSEGSRRLRFRTASSSLSSRITSPHRGSRNSRERFDVGTVCAASRVRRVCCTSPSSPLGAYSGLPENVVSAALHAGSMVEAALFEIRLDRVMSFRSRDKWPLVLRCDGGIAAVVAFQKAVVAALRVVHLWQGVRFSFTPHVTLLYDVEPVPETLLDEPITWTVRDFVLVHGLLRRGHVHLARWPLRGSGRRGA